MSHLIVEKRGHALWLTFNRPEAYNSVSTEMYCQLIDAWHMLKDDNDLRVAVMTGAGDKAFSSGGDLKQFAPLLTGAAQPQNDWDRRALKARASGQTGWPKEPVGQIMPKPVIAAVNGGAYAGGCELVLACDIRIASTNAKFGLLEVQRGLVPGGGAMVRLPRQIPYCIAMEMLMTGRKLTAEEALAAGLINRVVAPDQLLRETEKVVEAIVNSAPLAVQAVKKTALQTSGLSLSDAFAVERQNVVLVEQSEDAREGPRAFAEKRPARFTGR